MVQKRTALWTHGNAAVSEFNQSKAIYRGFGATFVIPAGGDWIHIPLTAPALLEDARGTVDRWFVLYNAQNCFIGALHFFDNTSRISEHQLHSGFTGDHTGGIDTRNSFAPSDPKPTIFLGPGVSMNVAPLGGATGSFFVSSAGVDYLYNR